MTVYKRLTESTDTFLEIESPVTTKQLQERTKDYEKLTPKKFAFKVNKYAFQPVYFHWKGKEFGIQMNHCTNHLCKNFGLPQQKFDVKGKPSRYRIEGNINRKSVKCNPEKRDPDDVPTQNCHSEAISSWSLIEEMERLVRFNSLKPLEPSYQFHKEGCPVASTPFTNPKDFLKKGISKSKSQKFQCKTCNKYTNVLPTKIRNVNYHQQRNEILVRFATQLVNKTSINRTCEILKIGKGTYYQKLEWLYRCCLEFLETRETKALEKKSFDEMWLNTDKLHYVLNNVLKKGQGKNSSRHLDEKQLPTFVVTTADTVSNYVFRADIAYDWDISFENIESDTVKYKEDHLSSFQHKNDRYGKYSAYPMIPSANDTQTFTEYKEQLEEVRTRKLYVDGLHVNAGYTTKAHLWLIKQTIQAKKWRFVTDDDASLINSYARVFKEEIKAKDAHHLLCLTDKTITRKQAEIDFFSSIRSLKYWGEKNGYEKISLRTLALYFIEDSLNSHEFHHKKISKNGEIYFEHALNRMKHPVPTSDRGHRELDVLTDISHLTHFQQASLLVNVDDNAVNQFLQTVRRRISVLERPIVTARGDGKSYIYANFYPKYSQMALTILRTYYNFCLPYRKGDKKETPAQRLGIADRVYAWEDIIYKR